jgi:CheY-like chemotaxis protein
MIIGLTGTYGSGKDTVAAYLEKSRGFMHYSLSDVLRRELETKGLPPTRENLIKIGTELRQNEGSSVLAKRVLANLASGRNYIITSVRHPAEIGELKKREGFFMVNVDAPAEVRFARICNRARPGDPETLEKLLEMEKLESQISGPGQQLGECRKLADYTLLNDTSNLETLHRRIEEMLSRMGARIGVIMADYKIMIVDDDPDANYHLQRVLEHNGFKVVYYYDAETALKNIKNEKPDMIIMDVMMPGMGGFEACGKIKNDPETSAIPVIILTAKDMGDDVEAAMNNKADWFITKPYDNKYLIAKINELLEKKL